MFHIILVHSLHLNVSHDCVFMSMIWALWTLSVFNDHVIYIASWQIFCFIPYLKDFVLVYKFFYITSYGILHMVEFFKQSLFSNLFLITPTIQRADGWVTMLMYALYWKDPMIHVHELGGSYMMYTLDHYCCFNWYHWNSFNWYQF